MPKKKALTARLGAAMLTGALLAGIGVSTALAAPAHTTAVGASAASVAARAAAPVPAPPPPTHPDASKAYFDFYLYNNTQYEWTLEPGWTHSYVKNGNGDWVDSPWVNHPPPTVIQPGQAISMAKLARTGSQNGQDVWLSYSFKAVDSVGAHTYMINLRATDLDALPSYSMRWDGQWVEDSSVFYTGWQQYAPSNSVGGFLRLTAGDCAKIARDKEAWKGVYRGIVYMEKDNLRLIGQNFYLEADGAQARATMGLGMFGEDEFQKGNYHIDGDGTFVFNTTSAAHDGTVITMKPTSCSSKGGVSSASVRIAPYVGSTMVSYKPLDNRS